MTREELKAHCKKQIENCEMWAKYKGEKPSGKVYEEHKLILELLEQEPCADAVSRQAVKNTIFTECTGDKLDIDLAKVLLLQRAIKTLPPVTPQEPCEDEYIKVPKKALKYRTAGMVAYNAEWLKNHFDIERAVICGAQEPGETIQGSTYGGVSWSGTYKPQQPSEDCISRQAVNILVDELARAISDERCCISRGRSTATIMQDILDLPPVNPQEPKTGWIPVSERLAEFNGRYLTSLPSRLIHEEYNVMILNFAKSLYGVPNKEAWYEVDSNMVLNEVPGVIAWMPLPEPYKSASEKVLNTTTFCGPSDPDYADKEAMSFRQWLFNGFGMTVEQFESSTTAYGKKFFHDQYLKYLSERNAITTGKAIGVAE